MGIDPQPLDRHGTHTGRSVRPVTSGPNDSGWKSASPSPDNMAVWRQHAREEWTGTGAPKGTSGLAPPDRTGQTVTPGGWAGTGAPKQPNVGEPRTGSFNAGASSARNPGSGTDYDPTPEQQEYRNHQAYAAASQTRQAMNAVRQPVSVHNNPGADNEMLAGGMTMGEGYRDEQADYDG